MYSTVLYLKHEFSDPCKRRKMNVQGTGELFCPSQLSEMNFFAPNEFPCSFKKKKEGLCWPFEPQPMNFRVHMENNVYIKWISQTCAHSSSSKNELLCRFNYQIKELHSCFLFKNEKRISCPFGPLLHELLLCPL